MSKLLFYVASRAHASACVEFLFFLDTELELPTLEHSEEVSSLTVCKIAECTVESATVEY